MMASAFVRSSLFAIGLVGAFPISAASADFSPGNHVAPGSKAAGLDHCVRDTEFMRRNHMELILHERHVIVHEGIRDTKYSLSGCIACHVSYDQEGHPVPIYSEGQFCHTCHEFAAVDLTCFGCHATVPAHTDAEARYEVPPQTGEQTKDANGPQFSSVQSARTSAAPIPHGIAKELGD